MAVTIEDVARRAVVNKSTVSRVLSGSSVISDKTKERVQLAVEELGYVRNIAARRLASSTVNSIGVIFPPMTDMVNQPFFMKILTAINDKARKIDVTVGIATGYSIKDLEHQVRMMYLEKRVDGFIILYAGETDSVREYLLKEKVPFVLVGTPDENNKAISQVDNDNWALGAEAAKLLIARGADKLAFVTNTLKGKFFHERFSGFQNIVGKSGRLIEINKFELQGETGLVVIDDALGVSVIQKLKDEGLCVPEDVSVIAFNTSFLDELVHPSLTTFDINATKLGQEAVRILRKEISTGKISQIQVPFKLIERESVSKIPV